MLVYIVRGIGYFTAFCLTCALALFANYLFLPILARAMYAVYHPIFAAIVIGGVSTTIFILPYCITVYVFYKLWLHDMRTPVPRLYSRTGLFFSLLADAAQTTRWGLVLAPAVVFLNGHGFDRSWHRAAYDASLGGQIAATVLHFRVLLRWVPVITNGFDLQAARNEALRHGVPWGT